MSRFIPFTRLSSIVLGVYLTLGATPVSQAEPREYVIDPEHFSVGFLVMHIGYADTLGMFREASGSFTFDEETKELSDINIVVKTDSVFTNHEKRDNHLRSADFLHTDQFPQMTFTADSARPTGERTFQVTGELSLLGKTNPLTLDLTWNKSGHYPFTVGLLQGLPYVLGASARGTLNRSDYGMNYAVDNGWVGDEVELIIEFEARRQ